MKTHEMMESKFLKKEDVGAGTLLTVAEIKKYNVAMQGADPEFKFCMVFEETEKPLVLNSTNIQLAEKAFGSDETETWMGKKIVLYTDPNVSFAGKIVGGIRLRAPKVAQPEHRPPSKLPQENVDDDVPF